MEVSKIKGPIFGSPCNKSPTILGYILGPLIFGISHVPEYYDPDSKNPQETGPQLTFGSPHSLGSYLGVSKTVEGALVGLLITRITV